MINFPRFIKCIIVHCLDTPETMSAGFVECNRWHKKRGFKKHAYGKTIHCGYHYIIRQNGVIEVGRPEGISGAHCRGYNSNSIGIALEGRYKFTKQQFASLKMLVSDIKIRYGDYGDHVETYPHNHFNKNKTCPNFDINAVIG